MQIRNIMEEVVQQNLSRVLRMYPDCCTCEKCQQDILLLALNNLPPKIYFHPAGRCLYQTEAYRDSG